MTYTGGGLTINLYFIGSPKHW